MRRARVRRMMERASLGQLSPRRWERLRAELLAHEGLRQEYDTMAAALRCLEDHPVHADEHALVESLLLGPDPEQQVPTRGRNVGFGLGIAVAAALGLALVIVPPGGGRAGQGGLESTESFVARGKPLAPALGLMLVCGPEDAQAGTLADATVDGCDLEDIMTFAYRLPGEGELEHGYLSAFGLAEDGTLLYYAPTPTEPQPVAVRSNQFAASEVSVRLSVNHDVGPVHIFAIVSPQPLPAEYLELAAAQLARTELDAEGPDWTRSLTFPARSLLCSDHTCLTARFDLEIHP